MIKSMLEKIFNIFLIDKHTSSRTIESNQYVYPIYLSQSFSDLFVLHLSWRVVLMRAVR